MTEFEKQALQKLKAISSMAAVMVGMFFAHSCTMKSSLMDIESKLQRLEEGKK